MFTKRFLLFFICICSCISNVTFWQTCVESWPAFINEYVWKVSAEWYAHEDSLVNLLINKQETSEQRKWLIYHFCDTLLQTRDDGNMEHQCFSHDSFTYDPRQSLFVYSLCVNIEDKNGDLKTFPNKDWKNKFMVGSFDLSAYIEDDLDLNEVWWISLQDKIDGGVVKNNCNPRTSMNGCELSYVLPHMFQHIMNTYSNMKLATIYGYKYILEGDSDEAKKTHIEQAIQDFSTAYFSPAKSWTASASDNECGAAWVTYISSAENAWDKKHCSHPQAYNMVEETILSAWKLIEKIDWLKADEIIANECITAQENMMACAFSNKWSYFGDSDWKDFQNLYLNELMFYNLFITYYANEIIDDVTYNEISFWSISAAAERNYDEYAALQNEVELHKQATYQSMRTLSQVYVSYPMHVALMAYLEDLLKYRKEFVKLYSPLNQLYYLLRNVQSCEA